MAMIAGEYEYPATRITRLIANQEPVLAAAFHLAVKNIWDQNTLEELANLIAAGRFEEALAGLKSAGEIMANASGRSIIAAGDQAAVRTASA